jgi:predicted MPP superfamily phosphohydrolase
MHGITSRRRFMRKLLTSAALATFTSRASASAGGAKVSDWRKLRLAKVEITLPHLPASMDGFRIVQISDLHLEPFTKMHQIHATVNACNALKPDLIAITGDFMTNTSRSAGRLTEVLGQLHAPQGVHACLGNHDFWSGHEALEKALKDRKISVLRNQTRPIHTDRGVLHLAGVDSCYTGRPRVRQSLEGWKAKQPLVLMMHEPDVADVFADAQIEALQLSGHTHGGQLCFMGMTPMTFRRPRWGRKYLAGRYDVGSVQLYVNRGVGCVGLPLRVGAPPEVTELTLRSPELARQA